MTRAPGWRRWPPRRGKHRGNSSGRPQLGGSLALPGATWPLWGCPRPRPRSLGGPQGPKRHRILVLARPVPAATVGHDESRRTQAGPPTARAWLQGTRAPPRASARPGVLHRRSALIWGSLFIVDCDGRHIQPTSLPAPCPHMKVSPHFPSWPCLGDWGSRTSLSIASGTRRKGQGSLVVLN